jgi:hypothetical protein
MTRRERKRRVREEAHALLRYQMQRRLRSVVSAQSRKPRDRGDLLGLDMESRRLIEEMAT